MDIFADWKLQPDELSLIVTENPSLRGFIFGYLAEFKLRRYLESQACITNVKKYDDHNRNKKSDVAFDYKGWEFNIEVKSLQTNTIKEKDGIQHATFQCDASDRRTVIFPDKSRLETTCLRVGEFDILAVNLYQFTKEWTFAFALNRSLPRSAYKKYTEYQRKHLLAASMHVTWPIDDTFTLDLFSLLDELIKKKERPEENEALPEVLTEELNLL